MNTSTTLPQSEQAASVLPDPPLSTSQPGTQTTSAHVPPAQAAVAPSVTYEKPRHTALIIACLALLGVILLALGARNWILRVREDLGQKLVEVATQQKTDQVQRSQGQAKLDDLTIRLGVLENKLKESSAQQQALEQLYQSLMRGRDETALAEVEQLLSLAQQQLQLLGNIDGAIVALQQAEQRLGSSDRPGFAAVRRAVRRDFDKLRALPKSDLMQWAIQLDEVMRSLDAMPLLADSATSITTSASPDSVKNLGPTVASSEADSSTTGSPEGNEPAPRWRVWLAQASTASMAVVRAAWTDLRGLIQVRYVDHPEALLLRPEHQYFIRENLRLKLLNARLSLLSRQSYLLEQDLQVARQTLQRYFVPDAPRVVQALATIEQVRKAPLAAELPNLNESLSALQLARSPRPMQVPSPVPTSPGGN